MQSNNGRLLPVIAGLFVASLLISNVACSKMVALGPIVVPGGTLLFPLAFIFKDILTEVYGYARSRTVIWTGLTCQLLGAITYYLVGLLPAASFWSHQEVYMEILGATPRIAIASLTAYFCGEFANSIVLSRMKYAQAGALGIRQGWRLWLRPLLERV